MTIFEPGKIYKQVYKYKGILLKESKNSDYIVITEVKENKKYNNILVCYYKLIEPDVERVTYESKDTNRWELVEDC